MARLKAQLILFERLLTMFLCFHQSSAHACETLPRQLGNFNVKNPAFLALHRNTTATMPEDQWDLLISSFDGVPFSADSISMVRGLGKYLNEPSTTHVETISTDVVWPNEIQSVPDEIFGRQMVLSPNGFLVPFKTKGSLELFDITEAPSLGPFKITAVEELSSWFYHRVVWKDMNNDGLADAVTCRADKPIVGSSKGQLLWLEQPDTEEPYRNVPWKEHIISQEGPDIFFRFVQLSDANATFECVVTAGYFSKELMLFWTANNEGNWSDSSQVLSRTIGTTSAHYFDVLQADLNGDGANELLVTINDVSDGQLLALETPDDFRTGDFVSHVILDHLKPAKTQAGKGAPGSAQPFYRETSKVKLPGQKPLIMLSGDDDGHAYILSPVSQSPTDWSYNVTVLQDSTPGTVGAIAIGDINGDGYNEVFVPAYSENTITIYTYRDVCNFLP